MNNNTTPNKKEDPKVLDCFGKKKGCEYPDCDCKIDDANKAEQQTIEETLSVEEAANRWGNDHANSFTEEPFEINSIIFQSAKRGYLAGHTHAINSKGLVELDKVVAIVEKFYSDNDIWQKRFIELLNELKTINKI